MFSVSYRIARSVEQRAAFIEQPHTRKASFFSSVPATRTHFLPNSTLNKLQKPYSQCVTPLQRWVPERVVQEIKQLSCALPAYPSPYVFTNDGRLAMALHRAVQHRVDTAHLPCLLVVGSGAALSIVPELLPRGGLLLQVDMNSFILGSLSKAKHRVQNSTYDILRTAMKENNPWLEELPAHSIARLQAQDNLIREAESLAGYWFMYSSKRFVQCQDALRKTKLVGLSGKIEAMSLVGDILRSNGIEIVAANLTNVAEHLGGAPSELNALPFHAHAPILYSTCWMQPNRPPDALLANGLQHYLNDANQFAHSVMREMD